MEILREEGVEYVFGNVGTTEVRFLDALQDYPDIKYILGLLQILKKDTHDAEHPRERISNRIQQNNASGICILLVNEGSN